MVCKFLFMKLPAVRKKVLIPKNKRAAESIKYLSSLFCLLFSSVCSVLLYACLFMEMKKINTTGREVIAHKNI